MFKQHPNMKLLIDFITINNKYLFDIIIDNRKIGPVLTKRIVEYLIL